MDRTGAGVVAMGGAGIAFALYPALRPYVDGPQVWAQPLWVPSHLLGVAGFALLVPGLAAVWSRTRGTVGASAAWLAVVLAGVGAALVLPYYGAEAFGLAQLTGLAAPDAVAAAEAIRMGPYAVTTFGAGLLALAVAGVAVPLAARRSGVLPVGAAGVLAAGLVLYLPQFFAAPPLRIAHGVLLGAGCLLVARAVVRPAPVATAVRPG
ncbi:hypothetical protein [Pseudonocardia sp. HH130630-07]|uniref:hypothetical protein n=1 Tax=Pseudonocardia sp. HH130630-07 TaxID=1690815 RepID=UPI000815236D|nr:hypothetical protein [Pseudonocardia sp. HH130630-07]ANY06221.1 hypothetical protein AFB00_07820 [Pseudonocardia sp. HH130630-07]